jgi:lysophospholipase L1-like esterase
MRDMEVNSQSKPQRYNIIYPYIMGCLTVGFIFFLLSLFIGYKIGSKNVSNIIQNVFPSAEYKQVISLPKEVLKELIKVNAVIENAGNPTKQAEHNTLAVVPDDELKYVLRPDTKMVAAMLRSTKAYNFDPPILIMKYDDQHLISEQLRSYLTHESRLRYSYSIDSNGFRKTLPYVDSNEKVLIIGDSVPFGVGVDDEYTVASYLQKMVNHRYRIVNGGVGGYDGQQAFTKAQRLSSSGKLAGLIYVACQNDFMKAEDSIQEAEVVLKKIKSISEGFSDNITIVLHTYMEYNLRDIFLEDGWKEKRIIKTHALRSALPKMCKKYGYEYCDWTDIVADFMEKERSIFSRFALYADHCHLSPLGNRLMAEKIFNTMEYKWQEKS